MNLVSELEDLYGRWLLSEYPDEVSSKDHHIKLMEDGHRYDEFMLQVRTSLYEIG